MYLFEIVGRGHLPGMELDTLPGLPSSTRPFLRKVYNIICIMSTLILVKIYPVIRPGIIQRVIYMSCFQRGHCRSCAHGTASVRVP